MPFKTIEYSELQSTGEYEHRKIGMTYELEAGETPEAAGEKIRAQVKEAHRKAQLLDDLNEIRGFGLSRPRRLELIGIFGAQPGVCSECGCTEHDPCYYRDPESRYQVPCHWENEERTLCNVCAKKIEAGKHLPEPEPVTCRPAGEEEMPLA